MRFRFQAGVVAILCLSLAACDAFIDDVQPPIDRVPGELLNDVSQVNFLITGVQHRHNTVNGAITVNASLLSDQFFFDTRVQNATFPTFREIDQGDILGDNNTVRNLFRQLGEYRYLADDLIDRVENRIQFGENDQALRRRALYFGNLHGAIARYYYATYFGLTPTRGGGVINVGPFIPSAQMYQQAVERFLAARQILQQGIAGLSGAAADRELRVLNSLLARTYLYAGDFQAARTAAQAGMQQGDAPFQTRYVSQSPNPWFSDGGRGRTQIVAAMRFFEAQDPRAPVEPAPMVTGANVQFYRQALYIPNDAPITFMSWQENNLMLAELAIRLDGAAGLVEANTRVNANRAAAGLQPITVTGLADIERERDFQLFTQGQRLPDQRRFGTFHLPQGRWQYLPIPDDERNANPNL